MTRDEIIRMAREAGGMWEHSRFNSQSPIFFGGQVDLERFASLIAAAEREACCQIVYGYCGSDNVAARTVEAIKARGT